MAYFSVCLTTACDAILTRAPAAPRCTCAPIVALRHTAKCSLSLLLCTIVHVAYFLRLVPRKKRKLYASAI